MYFDTKRIGGTVEILASNDYQAIPFTVTEEAEVKAGMPMTLAGKKAPDGTGAEGILLYDVDPASNPNAALVVDGIVDWTKCKEHSGATADAAAMKTALPNITFRENISVGKDGALRPGKTSRPARAAMGSRYKALNIC